MSCKSLFLIIVNLHGTIERLETFNTVLIFVIIFSIAVISILLVTRARIKMKLIRLQEDNRELIKRLEIISRSKLVN